MYALTCDGQRWHSNEKIIEFVFFCHKNFLIFFSSSLLHWLNTLIFSSAQLHRADTKKKSGGKKDVHWICYLRKKDELTFLKEILIKDLKFPFTALWLRKFQKKKQTKS